MGEFEETATNEVVFLKLNQNRASLPDYMNTNASKAQHFCIQMQHCRNAPGKFYSQVVSRLVGWGLIEKPASANISDMYEFNTLLREAQKSAEMNTVQFNEAFDSNPWNRVETVDAEYDDGELTKKLPRALELQKILDEELTLIYRKIPAEYPLKIIQRDNDKQQVLKVIETNRTVNEINNDASRLPSIIPHFQAVKFKDGKTGILTDWAEGDSPSTQKEIDACNKALKEASSFGFEFDTKWVGNFAVSHNSGTDSLEVKYVDSDIVEEIAMNGLPSNNK